ARSMKRGSRRISGVQGGGMAKRRRRASGCCSVGATGGRWASTPTMGTERGSKTGRLGGSGGIGGHAGRHPAASPGHGAGNGVGGRGRLPHEKTATGRKAL